MEKLTTGMLVYMFPYSHYIKRFCKKGLLSIPGKKKKCSHSLGLTRGKEGEDQRVLTTDHMEVLNDINSEIQTS